MPFLPDSREALDRDIAAVARIGAVPSILQMICDETGMGFAAVARVTDATWTACAVRDTVNFGLQPGGQLELQTTLCFESREARRTIAIDHADKDVAYCNHHTPKIYGLQSYISVPIILSNGDYFGNLCAIDARPANVSQPRIMRMFEVFAKLIALQLENEQRQRSTEAQLTAERHDAALREQFIAVLGHDLRNPLASIAGAADLLMRRQADPDLQGLGGRLKRTVDRMSRLIDDVLDFARGRLGGGFVLSSNTLEDLGSSFRLVVDELRDANPSRSIECDIALRSPVRGDLGRLQQLLSNLLGNAIVHGAQESPISVQVFEESGDMVISVANQGMPIPQDVLSLVFEPYWRPTSGPQGGGLGLGLYICKQIVEAHAGTIDVSSAADAGTCFTVRMPVLAKPRRAAD